MKTSKVGLLLLCVTTLASLVSCQTASKPGDALTTASPEALSFPGERHLRNIRQLTQGGTNAEAYWSFDGKQIIFQSSKGIGGPSDCDQIYVMDADGSNRRSISMGKGRTTCGYFFPAGERVLFSSTFLSGASCPKAPDKSKGYVWPVWPQFQLYSANRDGSDVRKMEPAARFGYAAEMTACKNGAVVFTSTRDGDLDLYTAKLTARGELTRVRRITSTLGYDGGAFFSPDCSKLVWRASRPTGQEAEDYKKLLKEHVVKPSHMELFVANADGSDAKAITNFGAASFAPFFTPDGKRILFASNKNQPGSRHFDLFLIDLDGQNVEQVTFSGSFDSFPMFSPDGKKLVWASNRNATTPRETNVFVADWIETPRESQPKPTTAKKPESAAATQWLRLVTELSDPSTEGRFPPSAGFARAAGLVKDSFVRLGLKPFFDPFKPDPRTPARRGGYAQEVSLPAGGVSENVLGVWGDACRKAPPLVLGAHLDHLGMGAKNSLEPKQGVLHPGADDNASGVATLVEALDRLLPTLNRKTSCVVAAAFTGEELGIVGSSALMNYFTREKIKPKAMLNLDMVGRLRDSKLMIFGSETAPEWSPWIQTACSRAGLVCSGGGDGYGPSDQMAFYSKRVPVLHFFTGAHEDYHRGSDTAEKLNADGALLVAQVVSELAAQVALPTTVLHYRKASVHASMGALHRGSGHGGSGHGAYLGTIPDYSESGTLPGTQTATTPKGVLLSGARAGSPADQAGVLSGDRLLSIDGQETSNLEAFTAVLRTLKPKQKIRLKIERAAKTIELDAVVGSRK